MVQLFVLLYRYKLHLGVLYSTMLFASAVECSAVPSSVVHCSSVQCSAVQCSAVLAKPCAAQLSTKPVTLLCPRCCIMYCALSTVQRMLHCSMHYCIVPCTQCSAAVLPALLQCLWQAGSTKAALRQHLAVHTVVRTPHGEASHPPSSKTHVEAVPLPRGPHGTACLE